MWQKIRNHKYQIGAVVILIIGFAFIRHFEDVLFYDPFLEFFKGEYAQRPLPDFIEGRLCLNLFLRYFVNTILSLMLIYAVFKKMEFIKVATFIYFFFFVILMVMLLVVLHFFSDRLLLLFYVRRFIIQPLFVLLFIPGFYFQQYEVKKQNR